MKRTFSTAAWLAVFLFPWGAGEQTQAADSPSSPLDAAAARELFRLAPGLSIEPAAAEPQVVDPVAIRFDAQGRMWVVEMRDYPHGPAEGEKPRSRIRILTDADGDGYFESAIVFADELLFATGVQPYAGGAFVTLAGRVAYMRDTDGDGRADASEDWFTGFAQENSQLRANHPRLAGDGWIYVANGLRGGTVTDAGRNDAPPVNISGMDFRFHPRTGAFEAVSGVGQFGLSFDEFGRRFVCSNRNPLKQIVLENRDLKKNPGAAIAAVTHDVAAAGETSRLFPISRAWTTSTLHTGQFTAACGCCIYRGKGLPAEFRGNGFTCDPTGNLVHREILRPLGAAFASHPAREGVEFLASPDEWFRPVNLEVGPDGSLYVVDMYRAVIEHPQFMPDELKRRPDLRLGDDRGRIWRIAAAGEAEKSLPEKWPAEMASEQLVAELESPFAWRREAAQRLLLESPQPELAGAISRLASEAASPQARSAALWTLSGWQELSGDVVSEALDDPHPAVREQAIMLAEGFLDGEDGRALRERLLNMAGDESSRVRFQTLLSIAPLHFDFPTVSLINEGERSPEFDQARRELDAVAAIALAGCDDVWTRRAVLIAAGDHPAALLAWVLRKWQAGDAAASGGELELIAELAGQAAVQAEVGDAVLLVGKLANMAEDDRAKRLIRVGLASIGSAQRRRKGKEEVLWPGIDAMVPVKRVELIFRSAAEEAADSSLPADVRIEAVRLLSHSREQDALSPILRGDVAPAVRRAAIAALATRGELEPWQELLAGFAGESPAVRAEILDGVLAQEERIVLLLDALEAGRIKSGEIDRGRADRLLKHRTAAIRERANRLFAGAVSADRREVLQDYQTALSLSGDPARGKAVFAKNCAGCHRIGDVGTDVAPDIADSRTKLPAQILTDVLQPNRAIDANYISYTVITNDGRSLTGILASETATSITLRQPEGKSVTLLRGEVEEIRSSGVSLMPLGLERDIDHQQMADLIAFIKNWRYLDGRTPLAP